MENTKTTLLPCPFCGTSAVPAKFTIGRLCCPNSSCGMGNLAIMTPEKWNERYDNTDYGNLLPNLPEHWFLCNVRYSTATQWFGAVVKHKTGNCHALGIEGWGETPRAAVLAAVSKIGEAG